MLTEFEFGWLAGLLEGEGSFGYYGSTQSLNVRMVDEDTVHRVARDLEMLIGSNVVVRSIESNSDGVSRQTVYYIQLYGERARIAMRALVPFMGYRRRQQIWRGLNRYKPKKNVIDITALLK